MHLQNTHRFLVEMSEDAFNVRLNKVKPTLVLVFFLRPHHISIGVLLNFITNEIKWERTQLLNASDGHLFIETTSIALLDELVVDFASAENLTLN